MAFDHFYPFLYYWEIFVIVGVHLIEKETLHNIRRVLGVQQPLVASRE